jgi:hypothetical protein
VIIRKKIYINSFNSKSGELIKNKRGKLINNTAKVSQFTLSVNTLSCLKY